VRLAGVFAEAADRLAGSGHRQARFCKAECFKSGDHQARFPELFLRICKSHEWIPHIEKIKLPEITVMGVQSDDPMLAEQCCQMSVRDQISSGRHVSRNLPISIPKTFFFTDHATMRNCQQRLDIAGSILVRERVIENGRVGRHPQVAH
jgi:hypothetical protein